MQPKILLNSEDTDLDKGVGQPDQDNADLDVKIENRYIGFSPTLSKLDGC